MAICELSAIGLLMLRSPSATAVAVAAWSSPAVVLTTMMIVGNVDAFVPSSPSSSRGCSCGMVTRSSAGLLIGLVASLKLTPLILLWWALATGHRRVVVAGIGVGIVLAAVAILGSEPTIFMQFINVTLQNYNGSDGPMSVAALGRGFGLAPSIAAWLPRLALVGGAALVVVAATSSGGGVFGGRGHDDACVSHRGVPHAGAFPRSARPVRPARHPATRPLGVTCRVDLRCSR